MKRAARESVLRARVAAEVRETLTAGQAPQPAPGTEAVPATGGDDGIFAAYATGRDAPFWRLPDAATAAASAPEPSKPLEQMDADEFRQHAADALGAYGRGAGFGSPVWQ